ncbi:hypothetical protein GGR50DRAFT_381171 [Xylaria sp. CBS 124048]|nr:hypothetical protein GGR50DRAFT_381171 [Xylaria sp. CBS 124048]
MTPAMKDFPHHAGPMTDDLSDTSRALLCAVHTSPNSLPKPSRKRTVSEYLMPAEKRSKTASEYADDQTCVQNAPITPFQTPGSSMCSFKVTKPLGRTPDANFTEKDITPRMPSNALSETFEPENAHALASVNAIDIADIGDTDDRSDSDAYPLDDDIADDDIAHLLADPPDSVQGYHIPPSSVQEWDHGSQSATKYDPTLKHSPPNAQETDNVATRMMPASVTRNTDVSEDLLDEDVDWNAVMTNTAMILDGPPPDPYEISISESVIPGTCSNHSSGVGLRTDEVGSMTAFVRPPFPEKIRDRPSVPGMSSNTLLRTCFRIGAMISQTARCHNYQQDVIFELFARVTYSNRESLVRKQHFQFVDLFKDRHPYPVATLTNWRPDSQLNRDSLAFLDTSRGPRLCRCMCKPNRDTKALIGWTFTVLSIKEVDWQQIRWTRNYVCGEPEKGLGKSMSVKSVM